MSRSFLDRVEDLARPDYLPNKEDILKVRVRTSGVVEEEYIIDGVHFVCVRFATSESSEELSREEKPEK